MKQLLIRRRPFADESFLGYLLALTELNGGNSITELLTNIKGDLQHKDMISGFLLKTAPPLMQLSHLTGAEQAELFRLMYTRPSTAHPREVICSFNGLPIHQYLLRTKQARFCPACLVAHNYYRRSWDIAMVTTCLEHQCKLLDHCPRCQRPVGWTRRDCITECVCTFNLTDSAIVPVAPEEMDLTHHLFHLTNLSVPTTTPSTYEPVGILRELDLLAVTQVLSFIGSFMNGELALAERSRKLCNELSADDYHATVLKAYRVLENWPTNYFAWLETLRQTPKKMPRQAASGFAKEFGYFYDTLFGKLKKQSAFEPLRQAFLDYAVTWDGGYVSFLTPTHLEGRSVQYLSQAQTKTILKRDSRFVDAWIQDGTLRAITRQWGTKKLCLIDAEDVARLQKALQEQVTTNILAQELQLTLKGVYHLAQAGLLKPLTHTRQIRCGKVLFPGNTAQDFIAALCQQEKRLPRVAKQQRLTWQETLSLFKRYGITRAKFYEDIYCGKVSPCVARKNAGLDGLSFETAAILGYMKSQGKTMKDGAWNKFSLSLDLAK